MSNDLQGRPYATKNNVVAGSIVTVDGDFPCITKGEVKIVKSDDHGLYIDCDDGRHGLEGQIDPTNNFYVGVYSTEEAAVE